MILQDFFAVLASAILCVSALPYIYDILKNRTKPHAFSWFVWAFLTATACAAQLAAHAGIGAVVLAVSSSLVVVIFLLSLWKGERKFDLVDWICLGGALLAMAAWHETGNPTVAVILVTITDAAGFVPTFRKGWKTPYGETLSTYALAALGMGCSLFALESYSLTTWLYPASLVITNTLFVALVVEQRARHSGKRDVTSFG